MCIRDRAGEIPGLGKAALKIQPFVHLIHEMRLSLADMSMQDLIQAILDKTGYAEELKNEDTDESKARLENIDEFINKAVTYEEGAEEPNLRGFMEEVALVADIDSAEDGDNRVLLMTLHSAKGLEFPYVYLADVYKRQAGARTSCRGHRTGIGRAAAHQADHWKNRDRQRCV